DGDVLGALRDHPVDRGHLARDRLAVIAQRQTHRLDIVVILLVLEDRDLGRDRAVEVHDDRLSVESVVVVNLLEEIVVRIPGLRDVRDLVARLLNKAVSVYSSLCVSITSVTSTSLPSQANSATLSAGLDGNVSGKMVREVASKTSDAAGDGTTTAPVLAQTILHEGARAAAAGMNPMDLKRGIDRAVDAVVKE